jgi:hypothetical protein
MSGACECGAVEYECGAALATFQCPCESCKITCSSGWAAVDDRHLLTNKAGDDFLTRFQCNHSIDDHQRSTRWFCSRCGTILFLKAGQKALISTATIRKHNNFRLHSLIRAR